MLRSTIARALGQRKIETIAAAVIASVLSIGIVKGNAFAAAPSAVETVSTSVSAAAVAAVAAPTVKFLTASLAPDANEEKAMRLSANAKIAQLPNLQHARVEGWIKRFTTDQRGSFATYLSRMPRYESMISKKLAKRDMPQGLIYLAMIESGFNPQARSPVKASGLWQFMSATGKRFGLQVNRKLDERNNPARSTDAALAYLSVLHKKFGSWYLAAAAYNVGEGRVERVMKQVTGQTRGTDADFYRISHRLPQETRDYVPKMIAAARIGENPARYGFRRN